MKNSTGVVKSFDGEKGIILDDNMLDEYPFLETEVRGTVDETDDVEFEINEEGFAVNIIYQMEL
jgi:hypothetical protein